MTYPLLNHVSVVESSAFIAAPLAGMTLAEFGADVIRIDMIGGGIDYARMPRISPKGRSLYWTALNKGKRSVAVDIRHPQGRELIADMAVAAGNLLTNIATPWLNYEVLATRRADLIACVIQGNADGSTAVDYTVNSSTGYPNMTGDASADRPVNHVLPAWDIACAHQAAFAMVAALSRRQLSGEGSDIKLALSDVAFSTLSHLGVMAEAELLEQERPALGNYLYGAFGLDFATADGRRVMIVAISSGQWKALVQCCDIGLAIAGAQHSLKLDFADEAQRFEGREIIAALLRPWFASRTFKQVESELSRAKVCWGRYNSVRELLATDPRVGLGNPLYERIDTPGIGEHLTARSAARFEGVAHLPTRAAPLLGTHTDEVLHQLLGLSGAEIGRLHDAGVIAGPEKDPTL
ncbi:CoA transferase [Pseudomonas sp. MWU13-2105]|uniref:CoA transferase n=1 Tax=Pseudomonas sp. MWU13-2105 TaxID=2935074 RepID=UPI00200F8276|nr:CoA transferase [Pseudomonas sp. MWU13-2105]